MRKLNKRLALFFIVAVASLSLLALFIFGSYKPIYIQIAANQFKTDKNIANWLTAIRTSDIFGTEPDNLKLLQTYAAGFQHFNDTSLINLPSIELTVSDQAEEKVKFETEKSTDSKFPENQIYFAQNGAEGINSVTTLKLIIDGQALSDQSLVSQVKAPQVAKQVTGSRNTEEAKQEVYAKFTQLKQAIGDKNNETFSQLATTEQATAVAKLSSINDKLNQTTAQDITFDIKTLDANYIQLGKLSLKQQGCNSDIKLTVVYKFPDQTYHFKDVSDGLKLLCAPAEAKTIKLTCTDCLLAPVDKTYELASNYAPAVVNTNLPGGGTLTQPARDALAELIGAAKNKGINITILSSYRSYSNQQSTFDYWVGTETAKGYKRAEAEKRANVYSARPGHSEHQLGTTVDLRCSSCASFDNSAGNLAVYKFIEENAHTFGYVISYPKNTQHLTGYTYEPWHIRFVGKEVATEMFNTGYAQGNGNTLAHFLALRFN